MERRTFITAAAAAALLPATAYAFVGEDYKTGLVKKYLAEGKTVFLDFYTDWCSTCAAQGRTIDALIKANPKYEENITFVKVDWDKFSRSRLSKNLGIPRRSTLVVLRGDEELGRIVAGTSKKDIKALLDTALNAAMA